MEAAQKEQPSFIDHVFTFEIMRNPALLVNDGEAEDSYEHDSIAKWLLVPGQTKHPGYGSILDPAKITILPDKRRQREIRNWCEDKVAAMRLEMEDLGEETSASAEPARRVVDDKLHVFVDHSNVTIGAAQAVRELDPAQLVEHVFIPIDGQGDMKMFEHAASIRKGNAEIGHDVNDHQKIFNDSLGARLFNLASQDIRTREQLATEGFTLVVIPGVCSDQNGPKHTGTTRPG